MPERASGGVGEYYDVGSSGSSSWYGTTTCLSTGSAGCTSGFSFFAEIKVNDMIKVKSTLHQDRYQSNNPEHFENGQEIKLFKIESRHALADADAQANEQQHAGHIGAPRNDIKEV